MGEKGGDRGDGIQTEPAWARGSRTDFIPNAVLEGPTPPSERTQQTRSALLSGCCGLSAPHLQVIRPGPRWKVVHPTPRFSPQVFLL